MNLSFSAIVMLFVSSAWAQSNVLPYQPLGKVKEFLKLSDSQLQTILTNNDEYNRWSWEKQSRIRQVQSEIVDETTKEQLDPNGLGIRYAEIEGICREMRDRANEYYTRNVAVLNPDQRTKLKVLEDAIKLAPVISEAQYGNLIGGLASAPYGFTGASSGIISSILVGNLAAVSGCYLPFGFQRDNSVSLPAGGDVAHSGRNLRAPIDRWFDRNDFVRTPE